ncbi:hypothetical protein MKZ38_004135 [Zalerion maritima]|uniref:ubiquitinyl hydrolase 1 n=1 Tax=Zalerion maritima TaxID=339359 RepID=A0AAD5RLX1_9PEZI|nr:hypothetical protein MKZ38_004135 [Zalerion maritima]
MARPRRLGHGATAAAAGDVEILGQRVRELFNHLVLPPRVPSATYDVEGVESILLDRLYTAFGQLEELDASFAEAAQSIQESTALSINGRVDKGAFVHALRSLPCGRFLLLHVATQNAGLFIQRRQHDPYGDVLLVEVFEASPRAESVLAAKNALVWNFPGSSIAIPVAVLHDEDFATSFATFLEQASAESIGSFAAAVYKAGVRSVETRETPDPTIITSFLTAILEVVGHRLPLPLTKKRIRDEVSFKDSHLPWRRLPLWLVARVALSRHFFLASGNALGRLKYKISISYFLASLSVEFQSHVSIENLHNFRAKLSRRLAKIEIEISSSASAVATVSRSIFKELDPTFRQSLESLSQDIEFHWKQIKSSTSPPIPKLQRYAADSDLKLSLRNSSSVMEEAIEHHQAASRSGTSRGRIAHLNRVDEISPSTMFSTQIFNVFQSGKECQQLAKLAVPMSIDELTFFVTRQSEGVKSYLGGVGSTFEKSPLLKSDMILIIMESWTKMDMAACEAYPLLRDFHPTFYPDMMDVLLLPSLKSMQRARLVQEYLQSRVVSVGESGSSIFADPGSGSFAERYYDTSRELQALHQEILEANQTKRQRKELEWKHKNQTYTQLTSEIDTTECEYQENPATMLRTHRRGSCHRCRLRDQVAQLRIRIHEEMLPEYLERAKAVVFELSCPPLFATYRDTTWHILKNLGYVNLMSSTKPMDTVHKYKQLESFAECDEPEVTLASSVKSYLNTHYSQVYFPVECDAVFKPHALRHSYCHVESSIWPGKIRPPIQPPPSFAPHCRPVLAATSPFLAILSLPSFNNDGSTISSYDISANQAVCPTGLNVHEFGALQGVLSGRRQRWLSILTELASANINFSADAVSCIVSHTVIQLGPVDKDLHELGMTHRLLLDTQLCDKLLSEISHRLHIIASNWREVHLMNFLITVLLRVVEIGSAREDALKLLGTARETTRRWLTMLADKSTTSDTAVAKQCQHYTLWSGLLCKYTFTSWVFIDDTIPATDLKVFVESSLLVQNNLPKPDDLRDSLAQVVLRDFNLMFSLKELICSSIEIEPQALVDGFSCVWPHEEREVRKFLSARFDEQEESITVEIESPRNSRGSGIEAHYYLLTGLLLINGHPRGTLPAGESNSIHLEEIFGSRTLQTFPSNMPGMTYHLCIQENKYGFHIGFEGGHMILKAYGNGKVLRYISREVFQGDLPGPLIEGHIHWLNMRDRKVEIYASGLAGGLWANCPRWALGLSSGRCQKYHPRTETTQIVDPASNLFSRIAHILSPLEPARYIQVEQPRSNNLGGFGAPVVALLPRLNLRFRVNHRGLLQAHQLNAEVDPSQDAGTWYGLQSKLVLRAIPAPRDPHTDLGRIILVPLGSPTCFRENGHTICQLSPSENEEPSVGKFVINTTLGRIDCAPEPRLAYTKGLLHCLTSGVVSDPLTGRTGIDEAVAWLRSSSCKPWSPLQKGPRSLLYEIAKLSPIREYYPPDGGVGLKTDRWNHDICVTAQSDRLRPVVEEILLISDNLATFHTLAADCVEPYVAHGSLDLTNRAIVFRQRFEVSSSSIQPDFEAKWDFPYQSRHQPQRDSQRRTNVQEISAMVSTWSENIYGIRSLRTALSGADTLEGFQEPFNSPVLSQRLDVDITRAWGSLAMFAKGCSQHDKYSLMFLLCEAGFQPGTNMELLRGVYAFAVLEELKNIQVPEASEYVGFRADEASTGDVWFGVLKKFKKPPAQNAAGTLSEFLSRKQLSKMRKDEHQHDQQADEFCRVIASYIHSQWPLASPIVDGLEELNEGGFVDLEAALPAITSEWISRHKNHVLDLYLLSVENILHQHHRDWEYTPSVFPSGTPIIPIGPFGQKTITLRDLATVNLESVALSTTPTRRSKASGGHQRRHQESRYRKDNPGCTELREILQPFHGSTSHVRQKYATDLSSSIDAYSQHKGGERAMAIPSVNNSLHQLIQARRDMDSLFSSIAAAFTTQIPGPYCKALSWLKHGGTSPVVTPVTLLELLRGNSDVKLGPWVKEVVVQFGVLVTEYQRCLRIYNFLIHQDYKMGQRDFRPINEELLYTGHTNWNPEEYPDWLLLEIESNITIRPRQVDVALATIRPDSRKNSVLQMNMGEGKTSCIIPMAAVVLADGRNITRVSVPKALLNQTGLLLHSRLGGLPGRELRHVPFSRRTPSDKMTVERFHGIYQDIKIKGGVMLCLPEHQLSFMLSGFQRLVDGKVLEGSQMLRVQTWLTSHSRDIIDESDYTLAVRTQLVYPSGNQITVDGHPHRWLVIERILQAMKSQLHQLKQRFPHSINIIYRFNGAFPLVFFLRPDAEDALLQALVKEICDGNLGILPAGNITVEDKDAIRRFLTEPQVDKQVSDRIKNVSPQKPSVRQRVYLLRGLLVNRILMMALKKRWNVQYGLHPTRDPIAVPYHAKGVPSDMSEWGHPDVAILFTALSFYYSGLAKSQLRQALEHVLKSDDPASTYDSWVQSAEFEFPGSLMDWNSINLDDTFQLTELHRFLGYNIMAIDYYLNNFVFPRHAKQFRVKLQANGWDIPIFPAEHRGRGAQEQRVVRHISTGFSGTNDNRHMLPLTIEQQDLAMLSHTNAEVLSYLLQPRSRDYELLATDRGMRIGEVEFLQNLSRKYIRVLIDAGAQILEMSNEALARTWLEVDGTALAALFFGPDNKAYIITKTGGKTPHLASPFADDLNQVLVYLDQAHTRGTDLKFPANARGALTLGLGQTKDATVQAAMRLRQLGTTQSVRFFATPEVHQSIVDVCGKDWHDRITSADVIRWLLDNTCDGIEQLQPLYWSQGMDYCKRMHSTLTWQDFSNNPESLSQLVGSITRQEQQKLSELYGPSSKRPSSKMDHFEHPRLSEYVKALEKRRKNFQDTGKAVHASALQEVEQEREVTFEVESVRQVKKPPKFNPYKVPGLHNDIRRLVETGRMPPGTAGDGVFIPSIDALSRSVIGRKHRVNVSEGIGRVFVTAEFQRTVKLHATEPNDNYLRPVRFMLWCSKIERAVLVTPEEAEALMPVLSHPRYQGGTHLLTYAPPVTRRMLQFNKLNFYSVPPLPVKWEAPEWLRIEVGLFSGRLYFAWEEYEPMCRRLGIQSHVGSMDEAEEGELALGTTDDASTTPREERAPTAPLAHNTLAFLNEWLTNRRKGQDIVHSPMGFVAQGKPLDSSHPFFQAAEAPMSSQEAKVVFPVGDLDDPKRRDQDLDDGFMDMEYVSDTESGSESEKDSSDSDVNLKR